MDDYNEKDMTDTNSIIEFITSTESQQNELVLTSSGKTVGAILTSEQYSWFLDQLDAQQDTSFVHERQEDTNDSHNLDDFKKEIGQ